MRRERDAIIFSDGRTASGAFFSSAYTHGPSTRNAALPLTKVCRVIVEKFPSGELPPTTLR